MLWEIELGYVVVFTLASVIGGVAAVVGSVMRYSRKMALIEEKVNNLPRIERLITRQAVKLGNHISAADQRDTDMKDRLAIIEDRFNRLFNGKH